MIQDGPFSETTKWQEVWYWACTIAEKQTHLTVTNYDHLSALPQVFKLMKLAASTKEDPRHRRSDLKPKNRRNLNLRKELWKMTAINSLILSAIIVVLCASFVWYNDIYICCGVLYSEQLGQV